MVRREKGEEEKEEEEGKKWKTGENEKRGRA